MLNFFRRRDTIARLVLGFFMVIICIAMVMFLIPQGAGSDSSLPLNQQAVATVNGVKIYGQDFANELAQVEQREQIPPQMAPLIGRQVLNNLVMQQAVVQQALKLGLQPSNEEIVQAARAQAPQLYPGGKYVGDAQAAQILGQLNTTLTGFQQQLRDLLMASKIYNLVTDPVEISETDVRARFERDNEKAVFRYAVFNPATIESSIKVTPEELQAYYAQHRSSYNSPERRQLDVVLANMGEIGAQIQISPAAVDQFYHQNMANYSHPEQVKAAHILIKFPATQPTLAQVAATRTKAEGILKQIKPDGSNFAALARQHSDDDATASEGGELGFIQRDQLAPALEQVAFSLAPGKISGLVQTLYGFDILKVEAHDAAHVQPEAEVHDQIVAQLQKSQAVDRAQSVINRAATMAQTMPLQQVAQQLKLEYFNTAPLGRNDPVTGIGVNPDFANAVFSTSAGAVTPPVQVAQGFAVAKVVKVVPPGPQPLSVVQDAVTADYKAEQAKKLAVERAQALQKSAQKQGLKAAAASLHIPLKTSTPVTRMGTLPDLGPVSSFADALFQLKPNQVGPVAAIHGGQLVFALDSLTQPSEADFTQQAPIIRNTLMSQKRNNVFAAYTDALMARLTKAGKITINNATLQLLVGGQNSAPAAPSSPAPPPPQPLGIG